MTILLNMTPIIAVFVLGFLFKKIRWVNSKGADILLKIVYFVALPASILLAVTSVNLSIDLIIFPLTAVVTSLITFVLSALVGGRMKLARQSLGVFIVGSIIMNIGFLYPFVISAYGQEGLVRLSLFDVGSGFMAYSLAYFMAQKYGPNQKSNKVLVKKIIFSPALWAIIVALGINYYKLTLPHLVTGVLSPLSFLTSPLIMFALGIYFAPNLACISRTYPAILIRMGAGLIIGIVIVFFLELRGTPRNILLLAVSSPIGYSTLTFASLENLDKEYAANLVSLSILAGIILVPLLILISSLLQ